MLQVYSRGVREFLGSLRDQPGLLKQYLEFRSQNAPTVKLEGLVASDGAPEIHALSRSAGGFTLAWAAASIDRLTEVRSAADIASDGLDAFCVNLSLRGGFTVSQLGRSQRVAAGSYTLISAADPYTTENRKENGADAFAGVFFLMPRSFVAHRVLEPEELCLRSHPRNRSIHELVFGAIDLFQETAWGLTTDEFLRSAQLIAELVLLAVQGSVDELSNERSVRASNLARAKHIMRQRLSDPELTLSEIAQATGLSLNYLQRLFREAGLTMYGYLKSERLRRARALLATESSRTITDICFECGFSDSSYFSRAFKQAFGLSPTDALLRH